MENIVNVEFDTIETTLRNSASLSDVKLDQHGNMYMFALCYIYLLWSIGYWVNNKKKGDVKVNEKVLEGHKQRLEKIRMRRLEKKLKMKNRDKQRLEHYAFNNKLVYQDVLEIMDVLEFRPSSEANGKRIGEASHPGIHIYRHIIKVPFLYSSYIL